MVSKDSVKKQLPVYLPRCVPINCTVMWCARFDVIQDASYILESLVLT